MTNSERNDLLFCSEFTDISKMDLHGLNRITGFAEDENIKESSDNWNDNGIFNCGLPGWTSEVPETSGIEDLEAISEDNTPICSSCGEDVDDALELPGAEHYCQSCIEKSQAERELYGDPDNDNDYRTSQDRYNNLM